MVALGALIALGAVLLLGVNLYVQSQGAQAKIQQELTRILGVPLKIRSMSVTPWGGLELSGITIAQTSFVEPARPRADPALARKDFLQAKTFQLRVRFVSLFSRRLVIKEVSLISPSVVWPEDAEGKWRLPSAQTARSHDVSMTHAPTIRQPAAEIESAPSKASAAVTETATVAPSPPITAKDQLPGRGSRHAVAPEVRRVTVKNGDFMFLDETGRLVASFTGVDFRTNIRSPQALYGDAEVARISLRDRFF